MKANEIQIGDLLYYKGQFNAFPFKVESITKKKVGYHAEPNEHRIYYLRLSECKPIPLTPEILEKNGFVVESRDCHDEPLQYCELVDGLWICANGLLDLCFLLLDCAKRLMGLSQLLFIPVIMGKFAVIEMIKEKQI